MRDNEDLGYKILARLNKLKADPYPHFFGDVTVNSETVQFFIDKGFDVRKLRCSEFDQFRIFYFVDENAELVIVCEIIRRTDDTYNENALHIQRIKQAYIRHFKVISGERR